MSLTFEKLAYIYKTEPNFFAYIETWKTEYKNLPNYITSQYNIIISPATRTSIFGRARGGILLGIKKDISYDVNLTEDTHVKITFTTKLNTRGQLIFAYCPPTDNPAELLEKLYSIRRDENTPTLIIGDFNCRIGENDVTTACNLKTRKSKDQTTNTKGIQFLDTCNENDLICLNGRLPGDNLGEFTYGSNLGSTVIDYAIVNLKNIPSITNLEVLDWHESDHLPLLVSLNGKRPKHGSTETLELIKWNPEKKRHFQKSLSELHLTSEPKTLQEVITTVNAAAEINHLKIEKYITPPNTISGAWFDSELKSIRKMTQKLYKNFTQSPCQNTRELYTEEKKKYKIAIKMKKKKLHDQIVHEINNASNSTDFWKAVKKCRNSRPTSTSNNITKNQ